MTMKTAACAMAVALLAGTASFTVPAAAQNPPIPQRHAKIAPSHSQKQLLNAVVVYEAGIRRGAANSSRNAYLRGFRDGTTTEAYTSRVSVVNSAPAEPVLSGAGYSTYDRNTVYYPRNNGYSSYDGRSAAYDNGALYDRYDAGYAPRGLMDVVVAPAATAPAMEARAAMMSYCTARYQSFDPASETFLADDGNRYFCR
jgi:BA14K-like protein